MISLLLEVTRALPPTLPAGGKFAYVETVVTTSGPRYTLRRIADGKLISVSQNVLDAAFKAAV